MRATVSFIIPNWNDREHLVSCIESVIGQTYQETEIIVIDNASEDGSRELLNELASRYQKVRVTCNEENTGFCRAINQGIRSASGGFVVFMNPDVTLTPEYIENTLACFKDAGVGSIAGKLLNAFDRTTFDSTGLFIDPYRRTFDRGQLEKDVGQYEQVEQVFSSCGGLAVHRRTMLEDVMVDGEVLDEDFFAYYDDADLGWRALSAGWKCLYVPSAVAFHARGAKNTIRNRKDRAPSLPAQIMSVKNRYLMIVKNDSRVNLLLNIHYFLLYEIARTVYLMIYYPRALKGICLFFGQLRNALYKRKIIKKKQKVSNAYIRSFIRIRKQVNKGIKAA